ncbi:MAG TPA: hypothetical protein V6C84_00655 [Coleofasciculaceae cyanobacterium]|jgi:hypothetical protein
MTASVLNALGGVLIFVIGQIILKLIIEPVQELKKILGDTDHILLIHQAKLTNAVSDEKIVTELKLKSSEIISKSDVVPCYAFIHILFGLPSRKNILEASKNLNQLSYGMRKEAKQFQESASYNARRKDFAIENTEAVEEIGRLLQIKTTYQDFK